MIKNIYSGICGTDVAVFTHGPNTGHKVTVGGEFGHEMVSRVVKIGKNIMDFSVGQRVYPYPLFAKDDTKRVYNFLLMGKIESRFVSVAVNNVPRNIDLLGLTYSQQSIVGSGGYMPEDVYDAQNIFSCGKWNLENVITHEFPLEELEKALRTAADFEHSGSVIIKM